MADPCYNCIMETKNDDMTLAFEYRDEIDKNHKEFKTLAHTTDRVYMDSPSKKVCGVKLTYSKYRLMAKYDEVVDKHYFSVGNYNDYLPTALYYREIIEKDFVDVKILGHCPDRIYVEKPPSDRWILRIKFRGFLYLYYDDYVDEYCYPIGGH